jgi:hypothetical protein
MATCWARQPISGTCRTRSSTSSTRSPSLPGGNRTVAQWPIRPRRQRPTGAVRAVEAITRGLGWRRAQAPVAVPWRPQPGGPQGLLGARGRHGCGLDPAWRLNPGPPLADAVLP